MRASVYKIGRTGRGLALKCILSTRRRAPRAPIARVQYSMRHACSTMMLRHANVRKTCSLNSDHHFLSIPLLSNPVAAACAMHPVRAAWLQLTLRHSSSSSVLTSRRADVLVELAGRRRRKRERKAHPGGTTSSREAPSPLSVASGLSPPRFHTVNRRRGLPTSGGPRGVKIRPD